MFKKIAGVYFAIGRQFGNCFSPAIVLEWHGAKAPKSSYQPLSDESKARWGRTEAGKRMLERHEARFQEALAKPETWTYPSWATLTLRTRGFAETKIYWRGWHRFAWNSDHIARRWGVAEEAPHGTVWNYKGVLGTHWDV